MILQYPSPYIPKCAYQTNRGTGGGGGGTPSKVVNIARLSDPYINASVGASFTKSGLNGSASRGLTSRRRIVVQAACTTIGVVLENTFWDGAGGEDPNPDSITVRASIETGGGTIYPLTFGGLATGTVAGGAVVASDQTPLVLAVDDVIWVRVFVSVLSGEQFPFNVQLNSGQGDGDNQLLTDTAPTDLTGGGTIAPGGGAQANLSYTASAVTGTTTAPSVLVIGDSIAVGVADTPQVFPETYYTGFLARGLYGVVPICRVAVPGDQGTKFLTSGGSSRRGLYPYFTHLICEYGFNDLVTASRPVADVEADLQAIWDTADAAGLKVVQTTITTQTDAIVPVTGWTTEANQTVNAICVPGQGLSQLNTLILAVPTPLTGVIDSATVVCNPATGKWRAANPALTGDGTHPSDTGNINMSAVVVLPA